MNIWINNKNGTEYIVTNENIVNATNANDGDIMVMYTPRDTTYRNVKVFVRERSEFLDKFTKKK